MASGPLCSLCDQPPSQDSLRSHLVGFHAGLRGQEAWLCDCGFGAPSFDAIADHCRQLRHNGATIRLDTAFVPVLAGLLADIQQKESVTIDSGRSGPQVVDNCVTRRQASSNWVNSEFQPGIQPREERPMEYEGEKKEVGSPSLSAKFQSSRQQTTRRWFRYQSFKRKRAARTFNVLLMDSRTFNLTQPSHSLLTTDP